MPVTTSSAPPLFSLLRRSVCVGFFILGVCASPLLQAEEAGVRDVVLRWTQSTPLMTTTTQMAGTPFRMEVQVGNLDARLQLARCERMEAFVPAGYRLWGRTSVGVRCMDGRTRWSVYVPVTVRVWAKAWVLTRAVTAGSVLSQDDAEQVEVDWAEDFSPVVSRAQQWIGYVSTRTLVAGQAIRQSTIKPAVVFSAGQSVRVVVRGSGFSIDGQGVAMGSGSVGEGVSIRLDSGRVVNGRVLENRSVQLDI